MDSTFKAKANSKDFKIVLEDPRGRGLVLEDSNTAFFIGFYVLVVFLSVLVKPVPTCGRL